ncbi:MAG: B12-binding domain-containing radical SAM protein [Candidatus Omnitrophota bacterium]
MKNILLINPWIYDFAAYDLWIKPWGLLKISSILKNNGFKVYFVDTLDRQSSFLSEKLKISSSGTGKFSFEEVEKPFVFKEIQKKYKRYGLYRKDFNSALPDKKMDFILVSSGMTYWYLGAFEAIKILKQKYKDAPIILGGTYATLSYEHAVTSSGADHIIRNVELQKLSFIIGGTCDFSFQNILDQQIDYEWYRDPAYAVLRISLGCPFNCAYCGQKMLSPDFMLKDKKKAIGEIKYLYKEKNITRFAFYDDALLFNSEYITEYFEAIIKENIKADFYTPNGLHARFISGEIASLMKRINFINPILSLETADDTVSGNWHKKVTAGDLEKAISNLRRAGYKKGEYTVYLMFGAPGTTFESVEKDIEYVHSLGARISLSEFSPIPGTKMAQGFIKNEQDPLLHNNSAYPSFLPSEWQEIKQIKKKASDLNCRRFA